MLEVLRLLLSLQLVLSSVTPPEESWLAIQTNCTIRFLILPLLPFLRDHSGLWISLDLAFCSSASLRKYDSAEKIYSAVYEV